MRMRRAVTIIAALTLLRARAPAASAHAELAEASPEPGSELDEAPPEIRISFTGELDPGASGFVLTGPDGSELASGVVDLEVAERNELHAPVVITEPGTYTIEWTAVAADGHPESGIFTFGYRSGTVEPETPDTALRKPGTPASMVGGLLLWLAVVLSVAGIRRARVEA
jgi:methionine-rich copper-binding protein CopC